MSCDDPCECEKFVNDYYKILGIKKNADDSEIKNAFRRLAVQCNPSGRENNESSDATFSLVAEAYDVLSDPLRRTVYDRYGEEGLKTGTPGIDDYIQPYVYHGEPLRTYREFFATESPYADLSDVLTRPKDWHECAEARGIRRKEEALVRPLPLTLSEVFFGGLKKMKIERLVFDNELETQTMIRQSILTIPIKPGLETGTKIVFTEAGDQGPSRIPADIIFVTEDRPHDTFKREGANLSMTVKIFLREALVGTVVTVNTVDERTIRVPLTSIVTPDYEKFVMGEGLPLPDNPEKRGNLVMKFDVEFPVYLPLASKNYVKKAFDVYRTGEKSETNSRYSRSLIGKIRKMVDDDVPIRRRLNDQMEKTKLFCEN